MEHTLVSKEHSMLTKIEREFWTSKTGFSSCSNTTKKGDGQKEMERERRGGVKRSVERERCKKFRG